MATDKKHKIPNAPNLRFPEFDGDWEECELSNIAPNISSGRDKPTQGGFSLYGSTERIGTVEKPSYMNEIVLVARVGANAGMMQIVNEPCGVTDNALVVNATTWNKYVYYYLLQYNLNRLVFGSGQPLITGGMLKKIKIRYGVKAERERIVALLSLIDDRVSTQIGAIGKIESLITGITSKVSHSNNVKKMYLKDLLMERTERNVGHHEVYSVSVSEGVVNQVEYLGRSFAAAETSHYSVARYGDIIYTKSPTGSFPYGIVKRSAIPDPVAVSPLYGVYQPINENIGIYLHQYFCSTINAHNYLHRLIQKGAKNTINITNQRFLENTVPIPDEVTLEKYVKVIDSLTQKLKNEKCLLESYRQQKFYLLKNMFV